LGFSPPFCHQNIETSEESAQMDDDLLSGKKEMKLFVSGIMNIGRSFGGKKKINSNVAPNFHSTFHLRQRRTATYANEGGGVDFVFRCVGREVNV
jgi:hypothetical protein